MTPAEYKHQHYLKNRNTYLLRSKNRRLRFAKETKAYMKKYRAAHREELHAKHVEWKAEHKEQYKAAKRKWAKNNVGKVNANTKKYKWGKRNRTPSWLTDEQLLEIREFYVLAKELQWLSDPTDPLEVDHIVPLRGKTVSGLHVPWNLQILPRSENLKKRNTWLK